MSKLIVAFCSFANSSKNFVLRGCGVRKWTEFIGLVPRPVVGFVEIAIKYFFL